MLMTILVRIRKWLILAMYSILVSNYGEYKKAKEVNKNGVAKISHNEYKDVLLNKKYFNLFNEQNLK